MDKSNDKILKPCEGLMERERLFRTLFEQANLGITIGHNGKYMDETLAGSPTINKKFQEIVGRSYNELIGLGWEDITHPDDVEMDQELFLKLWRGEIDDFQMEKRYIRPDGSYVWVDMKLCRLVLDNLDGLNYIAFVEDISKRKMYEEYLQNSEMSKAVLLSNLPGMAYRCKFDRDWTMEFVSEGCKELTGYSTESLVDNKDIAFNELILPKYREHLWDEWQTVVKRKTKLVEEYEILTADGTIKWVFEQGQAIYDDNDEIVALEGMIIDVSKRKQNELKLKFINEHDALTGVYNRRYFTSYLENMKSVENSVVILANIKNFSIVNLTYGYSFAENLILNISKNLIELASQNIKVFHISIDRFVFLVENVKYNTQIESICKEIIQRLDESMSINTIHGYLGVLSLEDVGINVDRILKYTSIAAKTASDTQSGRFCFFNKDMEKRILRREKIQEELVNYVEKAGEEGLFMVFQPIIDSKTLFVHGFEALARFKSTELGILSPLEFIEIAENSKLIVPLGRRILRKSFQFLKLCESKGYKDIDISINISVIQLLRDDFVSDLIKEAKDMEIDLNKINLELTESIFSNNYGEINSKLSQLKELGVATAIDDFGTGYSSLSRESELEISCLKIDKAFIDKLDSPEEGESITSDIISLAHKLGHYVVAEGVETETQIEYLIKNNCDFLQGYYFSKPLSEEDSVVYIENSISK